MDPNLTTARLTLRPLRKGDGARLQALCGNWNVARMLARVPYPYPDGLAETWIEEQKAQREAGAGYVFAIALSDELIGAIGLERRDDGTFELGYWLGEPWWGQGYMSEAAARVVRFAFEELNLDKLTASYFAENAASGRIQRKCGFRIVRHGTLPSCARGAEVAAIFTELEPGMEPGIPGAGARP